MGKKLSAFNQRVLIWFDQYGRKDLPWQQNPTPYRVWISEIMLQQTQVVTVIPYYQKFMQRFSSLKKLASADIDEVLQYWQGLGYYARARNLHKTAMLIGEQYKGRFPRQLDLVLNLPGIGRSTAGAILSLSSGQKHAILDGNVKRVLARHNAIREWTGNNKVLELLWDISEQHTPEARTRDYNQAMMDLGATLCTRSKPRCNDCPLQDDCQALAENCVSQLPVPKPKRELPVRETLMLVIQKEEHVLLEKRPPSGIWGGLWSLPECSAEAEIQHFCEKQGLGIKQQQFLHPWHHTFSHYRLNVKPVSIQADMVHDHISESGRFEWVNLAKPGKRGLAASVQKVKKTLL